MVEFINRNEMYLFEKIYRYCSVPLIRKLAKTRITPNMVTIFNFILALFNSCILFYNKFAMVSALLIIVYYFLDVVDGNLARCTGKTSKLGANLDKIGDGVFYNIFLLIIGIRNVSLLVVLVTIFIHNLYSILTTYYLLPNIRKLKQIRRFGLKKMLIERGILLGIDLSLIGILLSIALLTNQYEIIYSIIIMMYVLDIVYRVIELQINKYISNNNSQ